MTYSRISRLEEKRTKKQLFYSLTGIAVVLALVFTVGIPLVIRISVLIGNLKGNSPVTNSDTTAPFPPTLAAVPNATNSAALKIEGYAEPESTVKLIVNGEENEEILIGKDGSFSFENIKLTKGENTISAYAIDAAKNESSPSRTLTTFFTSDKPKLELKEPGEGQEFGRNNQEITVSGSTDPGNQIFINSRFVNVSDSGNFSYKIKLADGENVLKIEAIDKAGNRSESERKVTYSP